MSERIHPLPLSRDTIIAVMATVTALGLLAGCWQSPTTGPDIIHWDRQTCERCQMVISERRHAAQVRTPGEHNAHAFDDLGCALLWIDDQNWTASDPPQELWVRDHSGAQWIDGYAAEFKDGLSTPMAYGFGVSERGLSLDAVRDRVREAEQRRRSGTKIGMDGKRGQRG